MHNYIHVELDHVELDQVYLAHQTHLKDLSPMPHVSPVSPLSTLEH